MLESAIDSMTSPKLVHIVLTGSTASGYATFIDKLSRQLKEKAKVLSNYKGCTEYDFKKGDHQHFMFVVDTDNVDELFNQNEDSLVSDLLWNGRDNEPTLESFLCKSKRKGTNYMSLTDDTLQDAACWLSYIYKLRSKPECHRYLSSRSARRHCRADRATSPGLADRAVNRCLKTLHRLGHTKYVERLDTVILNSVLVHYGYTHPALANQPSKRFIKPP